MEELDVTIEKIENVKQSIKEDERKIKELKSKSLDIEKITRVLEKTTSIIKTLEKEARQRLVRNLIKEIKTVDKHITEVYFTFNHGLGLDVESRTVA